MRKKIVRFAIVFCLTAVMIAGNMGTVASAKTNKKASNSVTKTEADGKVTQDDFAVSLNGVKVALGDDINCLLEQLGKPDSFNQGKSCLNDGYDKIYTYGGITITTYPCDKKDIVNIIEMDGEEATLSGIKKGSTKQEIIAAYGNEYEEDLSYITYTFGDSEEIGFKLKNDKVELIYIETSQE